MTTMIRSSSIRGPENILQPFPERPNLPLIQNSLSTTSSDQRQAKTLQQKIDSTEVAPTTETSEFRTTNVISGTAGSDRLYTTTGSDYVSAGSGDDIIYFMGSPGQTGRDYIDGGLGVDTLSFIYFKEPVYATLTSTSEFPYADPYQYPIWQSGLNRISIENLTGSAYGDFLGGSGGNDVLDGRGGNDIIQGLRGKDRLTGGSGRDQFRYATFADSPLSAPDIITDFTRGSDKINVSAIDAHPNWGISEFKWVGKLTTNNLETGTLGYRVTSTGVSLIGNVGYNSDMLADMRIDILGLTEMSASDVIL